MRFVVFYLFIGSREADPSLSSFRMTKLEAQKLRGKKR